MANAYEIADDILALSEKLHRAIDDEVYAAQADVDCDREHCDDDWSCTCPQPNVQAEEVWDIAREYLRQIRMGYTLDVTLQEVLEEMERTVRE